MSVAEKRKGDWMATQSGRVFWPLDPRAEEVDIHDIAHALGNLCRYGGHSRDFYSVAEHSIHVSRLVPAEHALCGLMHDATEAYLVDMPRPIKAGLPRYREIEGRLWRVIAAKYRLPIQMPQCVIDADVAMLFTERDQLLPNAPQEGWGMGLTTPVVADVTIFGYSPAKAAARFLQRFQELT